MCTLTVNPIGPGRLRIVMNRDELRSRRPATELSARAIGPRRAVFPIDPDAGGTWLAINDAGLCLALLNLNTPHRQKHWERGEAPAAAQSRGLIIPTLLACGDAAEAADHLAAADTACYRPFRLIVLDPARCIGLTGQGGRLQRDAPLPTDRPLMFTSSGLGDHLVQPPRAALFDEFLNAGAFDAEAQDRFHAHRWPDRPELSVLMSRGDAMTVSRTVIDPQAHAVVMRYHPLPTGREAQVSLPLRRPGAGPA